MIVRDRNGMLLDVFDGQHMIIYNGTIPVAGRVMVWKNTAYLKRKNSQGTIDMFMFSHCRFAPVGSTIIPKENNPWEVGAIYEHPLQSATYLKLVHEADKWVTFEKYTNEKHTSKVPDKLIGVHTSPKIEKMNLRKISSPPKQYDPTQQPYTDDDI